MTQTTDQTRRLRSKALVLIIAAGAATLVLGIYAVGAVLGPLLTGLAAAALALLGWRKAYRWVHTNPLFSWCTAAQKSRILALFGVAGLAHTAWPTIAAAGELGLAGWLQALGVLPLLAWAEYLGVDKLEPWLAGIEQQRRHDIEQKRLDDAEAAARNASAELIGPEHDLERLYQRHDQPDSWEEIAKGLLRAVLERANFWLDIRKVVQVSDQVLVYQVRVPSKAAVAEEGHRRAEAHLHTEYAKAVQTARAAKRELPDFEQFAAKLTEPAFKPDKFGANSADDLATALSEISDLPIVEGMIQVDSASKSLGVGYYEITLLAENVMTDKILPFVDDSEITFREITSRAPLGRTLKNEVATVPVLQGHGAVIAQSGAGKTNALSVLLAHVLRTRSVVWLGGLRKQWETWGQWIARYANTGLRLPFDWITNSHDDLMDMLLAALIVTEHRQGRDFDERGRPLPPIVIIIDEATVFLKNRKRFVKFKGEKLYASDLVERILQGGQSAGIRLIMAVHRDTVDNFGENGGGIKSSFRWQIALRTNDGESYGRLFDDYKLPMLVGDGEVYLGEIGQSPVHLKSFYMQEVGKENIPQTGGVTVPEVGWARRGLVEERQLDHSTAQALLASLPLYANRKRVLDEDFKNYLRFGPPEPRESTENVTPVAAAAPGPRMLTDADGEDPIDLDAAEAKWNAFLAAKTGTKNPASAPVQQAVLALDVTPASATVATIERASGRDQVLAAITEHGGPIGSSDIISKVRGEVSSSRVYGLLSELVNDGTVIKNGKAYDLAARIAA